MATRRRLRAAIRWALVGRRDGVRASIRSLVGILEWLDHKAEEGSTAAEVVLGDAPHDGKQPVDLAGWSAVMPVAELAPGEVAEVMAGARPVALANVAGTFYALDNVCPHAGGPLGDGVLEGCVLTCPWHGWSFNVVNGTCEVDESMRVDCIEVRVEDGQVYVRDSA